MKRTGIRIEWTEEVKDAFLEILASSGNVTMAAALVGGSRMQAYNIRNSDEDFSERWDDAMQRSYDDLEEELRRRAFRGVKKPVGFYKGKHGGSFVREYSDTLGIFLLKGGRPEKYRDNIHHSGDATGGLAEQLARAIARKEAAELNQLKQLPAPDSE